MLPEIVNRRSIRAYLSRPVSRVDIETVLRAGALAPSPKNRQPWRFTVALGAAKAEALAAMARGLEEETRRPPPAGERPVSQRGGPNAGGHGAGPGGDFRHKSP